ncbi:MAG TPA: adenosylmethionine--8-amino-7-oxononanoate transaminase, partial [Terriglobia bacterium]|nr:adenosylmethionine--8-amino-7-oxononanoate transaminase [Terriglobia bacterium]
MNPKYHLVDRDHAHIWHPYTQMKVAPDPVAVVRGEGVWLHTEDGRRLLDATSSWWVNIHGHSHPKLNDALAAQANKIEHVMFAGVTHEPAVTLAERLTKILPSGLNRIFYSDNGSTAVEAALKMAYQYWQNRGKRGRREFVALNHAYHGDTFGAMSAGGDSVFTRAFRPLLFDVHRAYSPYCFRCPLGLERSSCQIDCLQGLRRLLETQHDSIAAVIVEPMLQGAGGMIVWPKEFLSGVREICDRYDVLMIADEVLTGFGRTGRMFACEHAGISPDILCLSKALTGGYLPLAVTAATERVYDAFLSDDRSKALFHGHSYTANPLGCAVALASLELFAEDQIIQRVQRMELQFQARLDRLWAHPMIADVRGIGGVAVMELRTASGG